MKKIMLGLVFSVLSLYALATPRIIKKDPLIEKDFYFCTDKNCNKHLNNFYKSKTFQLIKKKSHSTAQKEFYSYKLELSKSLTISLNDFLDLYVINDEHYWRSMYNGCQSMSSRSMCFNKECNDDLLSYLDSEDIIQDANTHQATLTQVYNHKLPLSIGFGVLIPFDNFVKHFLLDQRHLLRKFTGLCECFIPLS